MSEADDQAFIERAMTHIELNNQQAGQARGEDVAMSSLYAAARYCAWMCTGANQTGEQMAARRAEAMTIFSEQFAQMFGDCYDDYTRNFPKK